LAGLGFKTFSAGEVLTASDVMGYIQNQMVMVFSDASARDSAISSPSVGMFAWLTSTETLTYRSSSSWENF
jgi:hypothetical protein